MQRDCRVSFLLRRVMIAAVLLGMAGCGGRRLYPVEGRVTFKNGAAYTGGGQVFFEPADKVATGSARGTLQPDGTFRMGTYQDADGVHEGRYRVAVVPPPPRNLERPPPDWPPFDKRFSRHSTSNLEYVVKPGHNEYNITVEK
jgi:hypothetical protein